MRVTGSLALDGREDPSLEVKELAKLLTVLNVNANRRESHRDAEHRPK
jgi:hypothetical protein